MMFWFVMCASASLALTLDTAASKNGPPKPFCGKKVKVNQLEKLEAAKAA